MKQKKLITLGNFELLDTCLKDAAAAEGVSESTVTEDILTNYFLAQDKDYRYLVSDVLYKEPNGVSRTLEQLTLLVHKFSSLTTESVKELLQFAYRCEMRSRTLVTDTTLPQIYVITNRAKRLNEELIKDQDDWLIYGLFDNLAGLKEDVEGFNSCTYFANYIHFCADWWDRPIKNHYSDAPDILISHVTGVYDILSAIFALSNYPNTPENRFELGQIIKKMK